MDETLFNSVDLELKRDWNSLIGMLVVEGEDTIVYQKLLDSIKDVSKN